MENPTFKIAHPYGRATMDTPGMNEFLKMDIFFMVTTAAVVVVTVLLVFILIRVLRILKNIEDISELVEEEGQKIREDIARVRESVREEGVRAKHFLSFLGMGGGKKKRAKKSTDS